MALIHCVVRYLWFMVSFTAYILYLAILYSVMSYSQELSYSLSVINLCFACAHNKHTELIQCPELRIVNGEVLIIPSNRTLNSRAIYSCSDGYSLRGNTERFCQRSSTWNGSNPLCGKIAISGCYTWFISNNYCAELSQCYEPSIENGEVLIVTNNNSRAIYSCSDGYILHGNSERFCQMDGTWNGTDPLCGKISFVFSFCIAYFVHNSQ